MAKQVINIGTTANDGTGDPIRTAFQKAMSNFDELYTDDSNDVSSIVATAPIARNNATGIVTISLNDSGIVTDKIADDAVTSDKLANSINTEIAANTAKVTNATHTGEVTGATALTIASDVVDADNLKVTGNGTAGQALTSDGDGTFSWTTMEVGDITAVTAGTGLTGGGNSGDVTLAVSGITTSEIGAGTLVTESEGIGSNDNDTTLPTSAAVKDYVDNATGGIGVSVISSNTTAASGNLYVLTANLTLTLPSSPSAGNFIKISNRSGVATCTVARNSEKIMGATSDLTLDKLNSGFEMIYSGAAQGWILIGVEGTS